MTQQPTALSSPQPRAVGEVRAAFAGSGLTRLRQAGSSRALFPRTSGAPLQMVLTNTSGGVTGGDRFRTEISLADGARITVTTQAAERAYRAQPGQAGRVSTMLDVAAGCALHWLPQETILFDGCDFARRLHVNIATGGTALIVEPIVFGRGAMGEEVRFGRFEDRIELRAGGETVFQDRTRLHGDMAAALDRPGVADGARAMALVALAAPSAEAHLEAVRAMLPQTAGASLLRPGLLVARILAGDAFLLRQTLQPLIEFLHGDVLPRPWMI